MSKKTPRNPLTPSEAKLARELYNLGASDRAIAEVLFGKDTRSRVRRWRHALYLPTRYNNRRDKWENRTPIRLRRTDG